MLMPCICKNRYVQNFNCSLNFQGFLCISFDNCFVFCGTLFGHLSSLAHVCYGGLPKRSQSDKVCTRPSMYHAKIGHFGLFKTFLVVFVYLTSLAYVWYGGLSKGSQSDKECTMPKLSASTFQDSMSNSNICIGCNERLFRKLWLNCLAEFYCFCNTTIVA